MKLTFEPVTNKIGEDYYIVPKNDSDNVKCVIKCDKVGAFAVNLLRENHNAEEMLEAFKAEYPEYSEEELTETVEQIRAVLRGTVSLKAEADEEQPEEGVITE